MAYSILYVLCVLLQITDSFKDQSYKNPRQSNVVWRSNKSEDFKIEYESHKPKIGGVHYVRSHQPITYLKENNKRIVSDVIPPNDVLLEIVGKNKKGKNLALGSSDITNRMRVLQMLKKNGGFANEDSVQRRRVQHQKPLQSNIQHNTVLQKGKKHIHLPAVFGRLYRPTETPTENTNTDMTENVKHLPVSRKPPPPPVQALPSEDLMRSLTHVSKEDDGDSSGKHPPDDTSVADALAKKVRVLCWVLTHPSNHNSTLVPIRETWGRRCNTLLFMSTQEDPSIPTVKLNVKEGRDYLWIKVKAAFLYVYKYYKDDADWFLRADDDTYMVVENLRYMLSAYNPREPLYFGCRFKPFSSQGYMSGGAGVVLSRTALIQLVKNFRGPCKSSEDNENDDVELGICLNRIGVKAMDTRDAFQRGRFMPFMPQDHIKMDMKDSKFWYNQYSYYPIKSGLSCCSDYAISFHYVAPDDMYALEYLIYHVRPFGINFSSAQEPKLLKRNIFTKQEPTRIPDQIEPNPDTKIIDDLEKEELRYKNDHVTEIFGVSPRIYTGRHEIRQHYHQHYEIDDKRHRDSGHEKVTERQFPIGRTIPSRQRYTASQWISKEHSQRKQVTEGEDDEDFTERIPRTNVKQQYIRQQFAKQAIDATFHNRQKVNFLSNRNKDVVTPRRRLS